MNDRIYTVRRGDTLNWIAREFSTSVAFIMDANPEIYDAGSIRVGQRIRIPIGGATWQPRNPRDRYDDGYGSDRYNDDHYSEERDDYPEGGGDGSPWFEVAYGEMQNGVEEYRGSSNNPRIVEYHRSTRLQNNLASLDQTPWCASFVNWCLRESGYETTDSARAADWANYGERLSKPREGCVVVIQNHVGFYAEGGSGNVILLGGNQSDRVSIERFRRPIVAYRWPIGGGGNYGTYQDERTGRIRRITRGKNVPSPKPAVPMSSREVREVMGQEVRGEPVRGREMDAIQRKLKVITGASQRIGMVAPNLRGQAERGLSSLRGQGTALLQRSRAEAARRQKGGGGLDWLFR